MTARAGAVLFSIVFEMEHGAEHIKQQAVAIRHAVHQVGPAQAGKARALAAALDVVVPDLFTLADFIAQGFCGVEGE